MIGVLVITCRKYVIPILKKNYYNAYVLPNYIHNNITITKKIDNKLRLLFCFYVKS